MAKYFINNYMYLTDFASDVLSPTHKFFAQEVLLFELAATLILNFLSRFAKHEYVHCQGCQLVRTKFRTKGGGLGVSVGPQWGPGAIPLVGVLGALKTKLAHSEGIFVPSISIGTLGPTLAKDGTGFNVRARPLCMCSRTGPRFKISIRKTEVLESEQMLTPRR